MPSRNVVKTYVKDGYYHIYNRGVEKRRIFKSSQDYKVFLKYLKEYLTPPPKPEDLKTIFTLQGATFKGIPRQPKNYTKKIELLAFCLMPNHFHLLIKQTSEDDMKDFMRSLATRYSMYFNKKYKRVGKLFQGHYKAVLINDEAYLLHLSRYIHSNPGEYSSDLLNAYSSYAEYLGKRKIQWVKPDFILSFFTKVKIPGLKNVNSYQKFVEDYLQDSKKILGDLTLED